MISDYRNNVSNELYNYLVNDVLPQYKKNDSGHGINHIEYVTKRAMSFSKQFNGVNYEIVFTVAVYHDIAHHKDKKTHEKLSAECFYNDEFMKKHFTDEERALIKEAIEDHRASSATTPRSIYGKIISSADRSTDPRDFLIRTHSYTLKHYPNSTDAEIIERAYEHASVKYGENGYAKHYLYDEEYEKFTETIRSLLKDKDRFREFYFSCTKGDVKKAQTV